MTEPKRTVGLWQGVALYSGSVLGTGVLVLPAIAARTAGPGSLFAWLALVVLSAPMALTYAALSVQQPDAGGFSGAIERAFGPRWGAVAGWLFICQVPNGAVVAALIAGESLASVVGGGPGTALALGAGLVAMAFVLNAAGLQFSATAQLVTLGVIAAGLTLIVGRALPEVQASAFTPLLPHGPGAVGVAAVQLFWAFVGWEAITPLAREFKNPRDIWRASIISVVGVGLLYLTLAVAVIGTRVAEGSAHQAPLVQLAARVFGSSAAVVVGVAGFLLSFIPVNAYVAGTSRLVAALAERRQLPQSLAVRTPAGAPLRALAALATFSALAFVVALVAGLGIADMLPFSSAAFVATYVLSMAAAVRLLRAPLSHAAVVSLAACTVVFTYVGRMLAWVALVAACAAAYQWFAARPGAGRLLWPWSPARSKPKAGAGRS